MRLFPFFFSLINKRMSSWAPEGREGPACDARHARV